MLNTWSPSTSAKLIIVPPSTSPLLVRPTPKFGRPCMYMFSNRPLRRELAGFRVWVSGAWKSISGPGPAEIGGVGRVERLVVLDGVQPVLRPEVGDEADAGQVGILVRREDDRVDDACRVVGELVQRAVLEVEGPEIEDLAVASGVGVYRLRRIDGGRGEHDGALVDELTAGLVMRSEGQLPALSGLPIEAEELVVAADARQVDDRAPVRRVERRVVGQRAVGQVGDLLASPGRSRRCRPRRG